MREDWLQERKKYITGTDISAILGMNPWKSPLSVYIDKTDPDYSDKEPNDAMHFGTLLEPIVASEYSRRTGNSIERPSGMITHPGYNFIAGNIDYWIGDKTGVLECKTTGAFGNDAWGNEGTDQVPKHVLMQAAWYSMLTGVSFVDIAVLIGGQNFKIYKYQKDHDLENKLVSLAKDFWTNNVLAKNPPHWSSSSELNKLYKADEEKEIEADNEATLKVIDLQNLVEEKRLLEEKIDEVKAEIKDYMKDATTLLSQGAQVMATWKQTKPREVFDSKQFASDYPDIYKKYKVAKPGSRVFNLKKWGADEY